jgi:hypothetical protein
MDKMNKKLKQKKGKGGVEEVSAPEGRRTNTSSKVFANLQKIVTKDYQKKEDRRTAKAEGKAFRGGEYVSASQGGASSKKFRL